MANTTKPASAPASAPAASNGPTTHTITLTYTTLNGVVQVGNKAGGVFTTLAAAQAAGGANAQQVLRPTTVGGHTFYSWAANTINNSERVFKALGGKTGSLDKVPSEADLLAAAAALPAAQLAALLAKLQAKAS